MTSIYRLLVRLRHAELARAHGDDMADPLTVLRTESGAGIVLIRIGRY